MDLFEYIDYYVHLFPPNRLTVSIPMRHLRDAEDPYAIDGHSFKRRYRFSQDVVKNIILPMIRSGSQDQVDPNQRGFPIVPELQILVCLRFYATGSFQLVCGDLLHVSQPAVSRIVAKLSSKLAEQNGRYITYPTNMSDYRLQFARLGQYRHYQGLLNVDGAIDCTHIKIVDLGCQQFFKGSRVQHHEAFRNRKSYFSINVQAIVGPSGNFMDIVARWAGSTHDSRIFQLSRINMKYMERVHNGYLVGDSGYPCLPYLLTPVNNPRTTAEENFNIAHRKTRNIVERTFGMWKRRFPCLRRGLGNKLVTVSSIIVACAVLHNVAQHANEDMPADEDQNANVPEEEEVYQEPYISGTSDGFAVRASIVNNFH